VHDEETNFNLFEMIYGGVPAFALQCHYAEYESCLVIVVNYLAHSPLREPRVPSDLETCPSPLYLCIVGFEDTKSSAIEA
jgi:hypothetical protein